MAPSDPEGRSRSSILVVDDDAPILEAVADILTLHGFRVVTASDGVSGLAKLHEFRPDLIISDIMMPDMDGYQFFESVRQNPAWTLIPFMFLTAKGQAKDIRHGYTLGADDFIVKPFETEDLLVKVDLRIKRSRDFQAAAESSVERMKEQLLTIFGHELRTPLTYIYGYANLIEDSQGELDEETINQMIAGINVGAQRLMQLTESLLMIVRIDSGTIAAEIAHRSTQVGLRSLVEKQLKTLAGVIDERGATVDVDVSETLVVWGVEYLLGDAIMRVLDNALRFCRHQSGHIVLRTQMHNDIAILDIIDNGIGVAPEYHESIFNRFEQIDRQEMEQQGIGLGLAIARSLIRMHGGDIQVNSQLGKGSTFRLTIPTTVPGTG